MHLAPELQAFMTKKDPSVDWSKVRVRSGGNMPTSQASTIGNMISFDDAPETLPGSTSYEDTLFHELSHVPQWNDGRMTVPRYSGQALRAFMSYAAEAAGTYGMHPAVRTPPRRDREIWDRIPLEQEAEKEGKILQREYRREYPDRNKRRLIG